MKAIIDSMLGYWAFLLSLSLGASAVIYLTWLKNVIF